jgi:hypothetical protein
LSRAAILKFGFMLARLMQGLERRLAAEAISRPPSHFEWGLEFLEDVRALFHLEGSDPRQLLEQINRCAIERGDLFFTAPDQPEFNFDGSLVSFESSVRTPYRENNTVHCRYFPAHSSEGRAALVLPHWNAGPGEYVALCRLLSSFGVAALRMSLPYHDQRRPAGLRRADYMVSANLGRTLQACRQAVLDARAAIGWLKSRGYERVGIVGTSLGSCIGFLTFIYETRAVVGVFTHVSSYFGDVVWSGLTTRNVRRGLEQKLTREEARKLWAAISPNYHVHRLALCPRPHLMISARYDLSFSFELSELLFRELDRHGIPCDRKVLPCGHYTIGRAPFKYYVGYLIIDYLRENL